ncbi:IucA/IucC family protein [Coxiella-like endosymbiont]|uniref:IucA/IucC family protein n=1 Tax=Coxiella-like endosymbiont TaxID=1592897 RepID=UPI0034E2A0BA
MPSKIDRERRLLKCLITRVSGELLEANTSNFDHFIFLEQLGAIGHSDHPAPKNKSWLFYEESLKYWPEFNGCYDIFLLHYISHVLITKV